jgi:hypothetical protein
MTAIREYPTFVAAPAAIEARVRAVLAGVPDPEIPVLSVLDLGIVRCRRAGSGRRRAGRGLTDVFGLPRDRGDT